MIGKITAKAKGEVVVATLGDNLKWEAGELSSLLDTIYPGEPTSVADGMPGAQALRDYAAALEAAGYAVAIEWGEEDPGVAGPFGEIVN